MLCLCCADQKISFIFFFFFIFFYILCTTFWLNTFQMFLLNLFSMKKNISYSQIRFDYVHDWCKHYQLFTVYTLECPAFKLVSIKNLSMCGIHCKLIQSLYLVKSFQRIKTSMNISICTKVHKLLDTYIADEQSVICCIVYPGN